MLMPSVESISSSLPDAKQEQNLILRRCYKIAEVLTGQIYYFKQLGSSNDKTARDSFNPTLSNRLTECLDKVNDIEARVRKDVKTELNINYKNEMRDLRELIIRLKNKLANDPSCKETKTPHFKNIAKVYKDNVIAALEIAIDYASLSKTFPEEVQATTEQLKITEILQQQQASANSLDFFNCLSEIAVLRKQAKANVSCFISYAWHSAHRPYEAWIQPFLIKFVEHLNKAGIRALLDVNDSQYGFNSYLHMSEIMEANFAILIGSESLIDKNNRGTSAVCHELVLLRHKRNQAIDQHQTTVIPLIASGNMETAIPPEYERYTVIESFLDKGYVTIIRDLLRKFYGYGAEHEAYNKCWLTLKEKYPEWFKGPRSILTNSASSQSTSEKEEKGTALKSIKSLEIYPIKEWEVEPYRSGNRFFIQTEDYKAVDQMFDPHQVNILILKGLPGAGKTEIAIQLFYHYKNKSSYSCAFFSSECSSDDAINHLAVFRSKLNKKEVNPSKHLFLLFLDNVVDSASIQNIIRIIKPLNQELAKANSAIKLIITTNRELVCEDIANYAVQNQNTAKNSIKSFTVKGFSDDEFNLSLGQFQQDNLTKDYLAKLKTLFKDTNRLPPIFVNIISITSTKKIVGSPLYYKVDNGIKSSIVEYMEVYFAKIRSALKNYSKQDIDDAFCLLALFNPERINVALFQQLVADGGDFLNTFLNFGLVSRQEKACSIHRFMQLYLFKLVLQKQSYEYINSLINRLISMAFNNPLYLSDLEYILLKALGKLANEVEEFELKNYQFKILNTESDLLEKLSDRVDEFHKQGYWFSYVVIAQAMLEGKNTFDKSEATLAYKIVNFLNFRKERDQAIKIGEQFISKVEDNTLEKAMLYFHISGVYRGRGLITKRQSDYTKARETAFSALSCYCNAVYHQDKTCEKDSKIINIKGELFFNLGSICGYLEASGSASNMGDFATQMNSSYEAFFEAGNFDYALRALTRWFELCIVTGKNGRIPELLDKMKTLLVVYNEKMKDQRPQMLYHFALFNYYYEQDKEKAREHRDEAFYYANLLNDFEVMSEIQTKSSTFISKDENFTISKSLPYCIFAEPKPKQENLICESQDDRRAHIASVDLIHG